MPLSAHQRPGENRMTMRQSPWKVHHLERGVFYVLPLVQTLGLLVPLVPQVLVT